LRTLWLAVAWADLVRPCPPVLGRTDRAAGLGSALIQRSAPPSRYRQRDASASPCRRRDLGRRVRADQTAAVGVSGAGKGRPHRLQSAADHPPLLGGARRLRLDLRIDMQTCEEERAALR